MKIISKFKDYYDYVANIYGGGDPKILYHRKPLDDEQTVVSIDISQSFRLDSSMNSINKVIVIAGKGYYIRSVRNSMYDVFSDYKILTKNNFPEFFEKSPNRFYFYREKRESDYIGIESKLFTDIAKKINQPVFTINRFYSDNKRYSVILESNIPILQNYGISSIISAEQMYQDISYYLCNTMHESPDTIVPSILSDKEKVVQYGFDVKQSFRHRK